VITRPRKFSDEDFLEDLRRVCREVGAEHYRSKAYISHGRASLSLINNRFGNFAKASARAGLTPVRVHRRHCTYSDAEILAGLRCAYHALGGRFSAHSFGEYCECSLDVVKKRFGTWCAALLLAGIPVSAKARRRLAMRPTKERCLKCDHAFVSPDRRKFRLCPSCRQANKRDTEYGVAI
jgi:hypothetical protein